MKNILPYRIEYRYKFSKKLLIAFLTTIAISILVLNHWKDIQDYCKYKYYLWKCENYTPDTNIPSYAFELPYSFDDIDKSDWWKTVKLGKDVHCYANQWMQTHTYTLKKFPDIFSKYLELKK